MLPADDEEVRDAFQVSDTPFLNNIGSDRALTPLSVRKRRLASSLDPSVPHSIYYLLFAKIYAIHKHWSLQFPKLKPSALSAKERQVILTEVLSKHFPIVVHNSFRECHNSALGDARFLLAQEQINTRIEELSAFEQTIGNFFTEINSFKSNFNTKMSELTTCNSLSSISIKELKNVDENLRQSIEESQHELIKVKLVKSQISQMKFKLIELIKEKNRKGFPSEVDNSKKLVQRLLDLT
ncbi:hypothetical protein RCL1_001376 [Eukaryota sp. TZLM3-RCL]